MDQQISVGNVNLLDFRSATPESVARYKSIGNVNIAITTPQTTPLLPQIGIGNLNLSIEVPQNEKVQMRMGQLVIRKDYFNNIQEAQYYIVMGQLILMPDVSPAGLQKGMAGATVMGQVLVPENLASVLASINPRVMGQTDTFPPYANVFVDTLTLDSDALASLPDASEIAVLGKLVMPDVLPNDLVSRKITKLHVTGKITCHAENQAALQIALGGKPARFKVIPEGYHYFNTPLTLDADFLEMLPVHKLYATGQVMIDASLPEAMFQKVQGLISEDLILCPASMKEAISAKIDPLKSQLVFYSGELWVIDGNEVLYPSRFDYLTGQATLFVTGRLALDAAVTPEIIQAKINKVHNLGLISANPGQIACLRSRLGKHDGHFEDNTIPPKEEEPSDKDRIGNINILTM